MAMARAPRASRRRQQHVALRQQAACLLEEVPPQVDGLRLWCLELWLLWQQSGRLHCRCYACRRYRCYCRCHHHRRRRATPLSRDRTRHLR